MYEKEYPVFTGKMRAKKIEKNEKKIFYEKIRHVPGRRSVQKTEDEKSKPVPYQT